MARPQDKNLIPSGGAHKLTVEDQSKGGKAGAASKRRKKTMKETFETLFAMEATDKLKNAFKKQGVEFDNLTNEQALALSMLLKAIAGDARMVSLIFDVKGEKISDKLREKEIELKEKQASDEKNEALDRLDSILRGLNDRANKETE